jgi:Methyltransferase domain
MYLTLQIHTFDPTVAEATMKARAETAGYTFHHFGLGSGKQVKDGIKMKGKPLMTLQQIMSKLKHTGRTINILKWDCEGEPHNIYIYI